MRAVIRPALLSDASSLATVNEAATVTQPSDSSQSHHRDQLAQQRFLELLTRLAGMVYVAEQNRSVIGYIVLQERTHAAVAGHRSLQLSQLYVSPEFHGTGIASQLMATAIEHARLHSHEVVWLGVSEHNARAKAFYHKSGFRSHGLHEVGSGDHAHQDEVMSRLVQ
jgi:diamine N-acetyltransferase